MDCDSLHLDLSSLSHERVYDKQCEEKAWLTVVCLTVGCSVPHYGCTVCTCIWCANSTRCLHLQKQKISVVHVPVCESVWLQSLKRYCFTYRCLRCYGHGGAENIMENDYSTSSNEGRWWRDFTNGFHMKSASMLWTSPHCHCLQLYILISKRTPHGNRVNVHTSKASGKIWQTVNKYIFYNL